MKREAKFITSWKRERIQPDEKIGLTRPQFTVVDQFGLALLSYIASFPRLTAAVVPGLRPITTFFSLFVLRKLCVCSFEP